MSLLEVQNLHVAFAMRGGTVTALKNINFAMQQGERIGLVGESGAGKSVLGFSIINLISRPGYIESGSIRFMGTQINTLSNKRMRSLRGSQIAMIFQDPMVTLNPVLTIRQQMQEVFSSKVPRDEVRDKIITSLQKVHIPSPEDRLDSYPHELSGGMQQRISIAIALLQSPKLIIADEPTTALDVTVQAEIISLLIELCKSEQVGLILITHDLGIVAQATQKVYVLYAGQIIESGATADIVHSPLHPYTRGLIDSMPQNNVAGKRLQQIPGSMPSLTDIPTGCSFHPRCQHARQQCKQIEPGFLDVKKGSVRCYLHQNT